MPTSIFKVLFGLFRPAMRINMRFQIDQSINPD